MIGVSLYRLIMSAFNIYSLLLLARILLQWFPVDPYNPAVQFIARITDPFLRIFRGLLPPVGMIDFSPILAFFVLRIAQNVVGQLLRGLLF